MSNTSVKLSYIANKFQVKLEIPSDAFKLSEMPPEDLIERAIKKMDTVKASGKIIDYVLYTETLQELWKKAKASNLSGKPFNLILAEGFPKLPGLTVKVLKDEKDLARISLSASSYDLSQWRIHWVWLFVEHEIQKSTRQKAKVNRSQIMNIWLRGMMGQDVQNTTVAAFPEKPMNPTTAEKNGYEISANQTRKELSLTVWDVKKFMKLHSLPQIVAMIDGACKRMQDKSGIPYHSLARDVIKVIQDESTGPGGLGVALPLNLLAGSGHKVSSISLERKIYPGIGKLDIRASDVALDASVLGVNGDLYDGSFGITEDWLKLEIERHGIELIYAEENMKKFFEKAMKRQSMVGFTIAQGVHPYPGGNPTLAPLGGTELAEGSEVDLEHDTIDIRESQQRSIVKIGDPVAVVTFKTNPEPGKDVYGRPIENVWKDEDLKFETENVERKGLKFFATKSGCVFLTDTSIAVKEMVVHKGNVNLSSGNIVFDGPVEIEGIVEVGAVVKAVGLLVIKGSVMGGYIHCTGDVKITGGVNTGDNGLIAATGNFEADFIENSEVRVGGNVISNKLITNSNIISGKAILVKNREGLIGGGSLSCKDYIKTANLGFKNGNITKLNVGTDWKAERKFRSLEKRLKRFNELQEEDRQSLREVVSRKKLTGELLPKDLKLRDLFQDRIAKERRIIDKIQTVLQKAKFDLKYNQQAKVFVFKKLMANIDAVVGGTPVVVKQDVAEVALVANKHKEARRIVPVQVAVHLEKMKGEDGIGLEDLDL